MSESNTSRIEDGGRVVLRCNNCSKRLMEIWIVRPHEEIKTKVKALCPYCGESSYEHTINGGFGYMNIADSKEDEPDEDERVYTDVESFEKINDVNIFKVVKKPHGK